MLGDILNLSVMYGNFSFGLVTKLCLNAIRIFSKELHTFEKFKITLVSAQRRRKNERKKNHRTIKYLHTITSFHSILMGYQKANQTRTQKATYFGIFAQL